MIVQRFASLFRREKNVDDISDVSLIKQGMSLAETWAGGPSVILGVFFLWRYGLVPGTAWMVGNVLTMPLLGLFVRLVPLSERWTTFSVITLPIFLMFFIMESLALLINIGALKMAFAGGGVLTNVSVLALTSNEIAIYLAVGIGILIVALIHRFGFRGSVISDTWQYAVHIIAAGLFAILTLYFADASAATPPRFVESVPNKIGGKEWISLGIMGILTSAFSYAQMWERIVAVPRKKVVPLTLWGAFFFGIYMVFVWIAGYFLTKNLALSWLVFIVIVTIATSTMDSAVAGMQFLAKKVGLKASVGSVAALLVTLSFLFISQAGIDEIWNMMAKIRWQVVITLVGLTILFQIALQFRRFKLAST